VEAKGVRFAFRRFGKAGGVPLVFNQHFTGTSPVVIREDLDADAREANIRRPTWFDRAPIILNAHLISPFPPILCFSTAVGTPPIGTRPSINHCRFRN
jgi:hypothetical protein